MTTEKMKPEVKLDPTVLGSMLLSVLDKKEVAYLICNGLESGSYATFGIEKYDEPERVDFQHDAERVYKHIDYPLCSTGGVWLFCRYAEEAHTEEQRKEEYGPFLLNKAAVERGLGVMFQKYPHHYADFQKDTGDAITGDVFLQCALLGECVYG